jgi:hypothetical protein
VSLHRCACGYEAASPGDLDDHFGEVFTPAGNRGPDGQVHAEAARDTPGPLTCLCDFATAGIPALDAHLLAAFTPADHLGPDGKRHAPAR